jgi:hypothetical protein
MLIYNNFLKEINWNYYKENIKTVGLVDKVEKGYTELMKEEYDVERICNQVVSSQSKELEDLVRKNNEAIIIFISIGK